MKKILVFCMSIMFVCTVSIFTASAHGSAHVSNALHLVRASYGSVQNCNEGMECWSQGNGTTHHYESHWRNTTAPTENTEIYAEPTTTYDDSYTQESYTYVPETTDDGYYSDSGNYGYGHNGGNGGGYGHRGGNSHGGRHHN